MRTFIKASLVILVCGLSISAMAAGRFIVKAKGVKSQQLTTKLKHSE